jgi:hypothetical protein
MTASWQLIDPGAVQTSGRDEDESDGSACPPVPALAPRSSLAAVDILRIYVLRRLLEPPTFIGRAHGAFGIPADMHVCPWFVSDSARKDQTLAQAIEERIGTGLND